MNGVGIVVHPLPHWSPSIKGVETHATNKFNFRVHPSDFGKELHVENSAALSSHVPDAPKRAYEAAPVGDSEGYPVISWPR